MLACAQPGLQVSPKQARLPRQNLPRKAPEKDTIIMSIIVFTQAPKQAVAPVCNMRNRSCLLTGYAQLNDAWVSSSRAGRLCTRDSHPSCCAGMFLSSRSTWQITINNRHREDECQRGKHEQNTRHRTLRFQWMKYKTLQSTGRPQ